MVGLFWIAHIGLLDLLNSTAVPCGVHFMSVQIVYFIDDVLSDWQPV